MPPAKASGFFHIEKPLDVDKIVDVQQIRQETAEVVFTHEREYKGVLFVSITANHKNGRTAKRQRLEFRAVVLGQSHKQEGKVVLLTRPNKAFQTVAGIELKQDGGIGLGHVHWCSGLQLKWVPHITPSTRVETGLFQERLIQDTRVKLVKDLFNLVDKEDDWSDVEWDEIEAMIDSMQRQLDAANSPKQRQKKGVKKTAKADEAEKAEPEQQELSEDEDRTNNSEHVVRACKFKIDKSRRLNDEEKARVKFLMSQYKTQEPEEFERHNHELASLLNKAFKVSFDIQILHDFTKARKVNFNFSGLQTFASFAAWWKNRKMKSRKVKSGNGSFEDKRIPRNIFLLDARNLVASCFRSKVWWAYESSTRFLSGIGQEDGSSK